MLFHLPGRSTVNLLCARLIERKEASLAHPTAASKAPFSLHHLKVGPKTGTCGMQINGGSGVGGGEWEWEWALSHYKLIFARYHEN